MDAAIQFGWVSGATHSTTITAVTTTTTITMTADYRGDPTEFAVVIAVPTVLTREHLDRVRQFGEVHVVELESGDLHEDAAARRLAAALSGPNLEPRPPVQSQARLIATRRGLVRVRAELVDAIELILITLPPSLFLSQAICGVGVGHRPTWLRGGRPPHPHPAMGPARFRRHVKADSVGSRR